MLNAYVFESVDQVREITVECLQSYNEERRHDALAGLSPATYRARLEARSSPVEVGPCRGSLRYLNSSVLLVEITNSSESAAQESVVGLTRVHLSHQVRPFDMEVP